MLQMLEAPAGLLGDPPLANSLQKSSNVPFSHHSTVEVEGGRRWRRHLQAPQDVLFMLTSYSSALSFPPPSQRERLTAGTYGFTVPAGRLPQSRCHFLLQGKKVEDEEKEKSG